MKHERTKKSPLTLASRRRPAILYRAWTCKHGISSRIWHLMRVLIELVHAKGGIGRRHGAVVGRKETACRGSFCCRPARDYIVLRSDFVEVIQHLAARPQYCNAQREDYKGGHFSIPPIVESYGSNALGGRQSEQRRPVRTAHEHVLLDWAIASQRDN